MKLLHTADIHIGMTNYSKLDPQTGLESRLVDFLKTFDFIVDTAISEQVDAFIFAGDAYKTREPSPTQQRGFGERIKKVAKAGIPVIMVVGNHDTPNAEGKANTLDIYSALEINNVYVSRTVELLNIATKSGNLQVITAPWLQKADFKNLGEMLSTKYSKIKTDSPAILVGHLEVAGATMGSEKGLAIINDATVPLSLLTDKRLCYVALGHIHKQQNLNPADNPPVIYSSSPERIDFSEENEKKGFMLVDLSEPGKTKYQFRETPARKFLSISIHLSATDPDPTQTILEEIKKHDVTGKVVKVFINIPAECNSEIQMDKIKKALAKAWIIASISRNVERVDRVRLEGISGVEKLTPLEALQKYFESKKFGAEKIKRLENFASQLME